MGVLVKYMFVHYVLAHCLQRTEEDIESPRTEVTDNCEPSYGYWVSNLCSLEKPKVFLTTELFLALLSFF